MGAPWTLAAYAVEAGSTKEAAFFKKWMFTAPEALVFHVFLMLFAVFEWLFMGFWLFSALFEGF